MLLTGFGSEETLKSLLWYGIGGQSVLFYSFNLLVCTTCPGKEGGGVGYFTW